MFDAKLVVNGYEVSLGQESLNNILDYVPARDDFRQILGELVTEGGAQLRNTVAGMIGRGDEADLQDGMDEIEEEVEDEDTLENEDWPELDVVQLLAKDEDITVLRTLMREEDACRQINQEDLNRMLDRDDYELLESIINNIDALEKCDAGGIVSRLARHSDPEVRRLAIREDLMSPMLLKKLAEDEDPDVRNDARQVIAGYQELVSQRRRYRMERIA
jgi:hypothetical protein